MLWFTYFLFGVSNLFGFNACNEENFERYTDIGSRVPEMIALMLFEF